MDWADDEPLDDEPRAKGPPVQRFGNVTDDVYKSSPAYTQSPSRRDKRGNGERGGYNSSYHQRERQEPRPIPEKGPFTAYVGNVPYKLQEQEVLDFFAPCGAVTEVRISRWRDSDRAKGAFVQFEERQGLVSAIAKSGEALGGRPLRIDVAIEKSRDSERPRDRSWSGGTQGMNKGLGKGGYHEYQDNARSYGGGGGGGGRRGNGRQDRGNQGDLPPFVEADPESLAARPKLTLKKRTVPANAASAPSGGSSNIFGSARPVDSSKKLEEVESKINQEKEKIKQEVEATSSAVADGESAATEGGVRARGDRSDRGERGFRSSYNKRKEYRDPVSGGQRQGKSSGAPAPDASGFVQPKHVQRLAQKEEKKKDSPKKFQATSLNAFDLLNMDDDEDDE